MKSLPPFRLGRASYVFPADVQSHVKRLAALEKHLGRTRVHLCGSRGGRDHRGLEGMDDVLLASLLDVVLSRRHRGVLPLEVFSERDSLFGKNTIKSLEAGIWKDG